MIKVLQFTSTINRYDFIDNIVQFADRNKFDIGVCIRTEHSNIEPPVYRKDVFRRVLSGNLSRKVIPQTVWQLVQILREWKPDILHTHHYDEAFIGYLATKCCPKTKLFIGRHYSDTIYRLQQGLKTKSLLKVEQLSNNAAERIIVPCSYVADILTEKQSISASKIDTIPIGFVADKFSLPDLNEIEKVKNELDFESKFVIGNFSNLHTEKGLGYLIEAAATLKNKIPGLLVIIAGRGTHQEFFERQIKELDLRDTVKLLGFRRDAMVLMNAVDVIVQTSLQESFGQVMVEALWLKKPLITTDVGAAVDIIKNRENGILIPKADSEAIIAAVEKLAADEDMRKKLGEEGSRYVKNNLVIEKIIKLYENSYLKAMDNM